MSSLLLPVYPRLNLKLVSAQGSWLTTVDGRRILDVYGGHAVTPLGHNHPVLAETLSKSFATLDFYSNSLFMDVQEEAARALLHNSAHLGRVHLVNSGTEANEAAIHLARRLTKRKKILSFDCSFHGRTLASLAATGLMDYRKRLSIAADSAANDFIEFGRLTDIERVDSSVAAVLCESIPSLGGIRMPSAGYYQALEKRCREQGAMLIFDEIQGGLGRTGSWFAHELFKVQPDMVTLAKGIAGGFPAGALLTTQATAARLEYSELGTTFGGGPLACQMICAVARVIDEQNLLSRVRTIFSTIRESLAAIAGVEVRGAGCLIGIQTPRSATEIRDRLLQADVMVGLSNHPQTIRLLPPYTLTDSELGLCVEKIRNVLS